MRLSHPHQIKLGLSQETCISVNNGYHLPDKLLTEYNVCDISIDARDVSKIVKSLDSPKSTGPNKIFMAILKKTLAHSYLQTWQSCLTDTQRPRTTASNHEQMSPGGATVREKILGFKFIPEIKWSSYTI